MEYEMVKNKGAGWKLKCPKCGEWCYLDDDQFNGKISIYHDVDNCGFHKTINFNLETGL